MSFANWPTTRLDQIATFRNGVNFNKSSFGTGIKVLGVSDFQNYTKPRYDELAQINPSGIVTDRNILRDGDIVFVRSNGNPALIGRSVFIQEPPEQITHSAFTIRLRFSSTDILPKFYAYLFRTKLIRQALTAAGGGTNISNLNQDILGAMEVPVPPLSTQNRLTEILSSYDELIENNQQRIRILEKMARILYREWFVHFRFPGHENHSRIATPLGEMPEGWEAKFLTDITAVTYGFAFKSKGFNTIGIGLPVIRIRDIPEAETSTFTEETADKKYAIENGDILVGMDGDFHMCVWSSGSALQNQRVAKFRTTSLLSNFHLYLAMEKPITEWNRSIVGTTVAHLGDSHIRKIQISYPPANVTNRATPLFEAISGEIICLKRQIRNLRKTRDLLLPRLLSGQIKLEAN